MRKQAGRLQSVWTNEGPLRLHTRISTNSPQYQQLTVWLIHGLSVSSRYMVPTAEHLAPNWRVYAPDLPGFGRSEHPREILDVPALADALVQRMDAFGIERAVLVGNSMGCQIIADVGLRYPNRLSHAVLIGPTMDPAAPTALQQAWRLLRDGRYESLASIVTQGRDYLACGPRRTIGTLRAALADRIETKLPYVRVPTLVIRGAHDPIAPQPWAEHVTRLLPHGRLTVLEGAPHAANYDNGARVARVVQAFLAEEASADTRAKLHEGRYVTAN